MQSFLSIMFFTLGAVFGSFLNVCIHRLPREESLISPGSHCPKCGKQIKWYDNVPFLSYTLLRGRCRYCGSKISARYFAVELITAVLFLSLFRTFGFSLNLAIFLGFSSSLIVMSFIDFEYKIIPDILDCTGIAIGLFLSIIHPEIHLLPQPWDRVFENPRMVALADSLSGIIFGGVFLVMLAIIGRAAFKKEAMGGGDIKLLAMIGAFLGWQGVILSILISAFVGSFVGIIVKLKTGGSYIPYGPYLCFGAIISIFHGEKIMSWYVSILR